MGGCIEVEVKDARLKKSRACKLVHYKACPKCIYLLSGGREQNSDVGPNIFKSWERALRRVMDGSAEEGTK